MTYLKLRSRTATRIACSVCAAAVLSAPLTGIMASTFAFANSDNLVQTENEQLRTDIYESMKSNIIKQETLIADKLTKNTTQPEKTRAFTKIETPVRQTAEEEQAFIEEKHITLAHHEATPQTTKTLDEYCNDASRVEKSANGNYENQKSSQRLTPAAGVFNGPSGKETYYNLNMGGVIYLMRYLGYSEQEYPYWVRDDGVRMFGDYVMVAADLNLRPKGTILESSLGTAIVVDTGALEPTQLDIAVNW